VWLSPIEKEHAMPKDYYIVLGVGRGTKFWGTPFSFTVSINTHFAGIARLWVKESNLAGHGRGFGTFFCKAVRVRGIKKYQTNTLSSNTII